MHALHLQDIQCPYCGETITVQVDASAGDQDYIEDCQVCCKPIEMRLSCFGNDWNLEVTRDDE